MGGGVRRRGGRARGGQAGSGARCVGSRARARSSRRQEGRRGRGSRPPCRPCRRRRRPCWRCRPAPSERASHSQGRPQAWLSSDEWPVSFLPVEFVGVARSEVRPRFPEGEHVTAAAGEVTAGRYCRRGVERRGSIRALSPSARRLTAGRRWAGMGAWLLGLGDRSPLPLLSFFQDPRACHGACMHASAAASLSLSLSGWQRPCLGRGGASLQSQSVRGARAAARAGVWEGSSMARREGGRGLGTGWIDCVWMEALPTRALAGSARPGGWGDDGECAGRGRLTGRPPRLVRSRTRCTRSALDRAFALIELEELTGRDVVRRRRRRTAAPSASKTRVRASARQGARRRRIAGQSTGRYASARRAAARRGFSQRPRGRRPASRARREGQAAAALESADLSQYVLALARRVRDRAASGREGAGAS